ncbi:xylulokinase [Corynebacterium aquatimens]|uniref:Xylulokinase n=1 Tax=Corynebacterium aquatimens TaxID=1190508 RepID=A0A931GTQ4_9CORY|nr:FGGY-family carbohydrate kinase [Corynebacterium aquatimens]MBG6122040.1 xylulokinase [Corynebacterium aquatimens]WJY65419.1 Xylulose kinase [Corynebacterium aquatimens]
MFILAYDFGTTGVKSCLFDVSDSVVKVDSASQGYELHVLPDGGVEQDPDDWWQALVDTTRVLKKRNADAVEHVAGISFCSQLQSVVMVDEDMRPVHRSMSYMDQRAGAQMKRIAGRAPRIAGVNAAIALKSLRYTGAVAASVKDPAWKYHWLKDNDADAFRRGHKWLDVKDALIARMTGQATMSEDSAFATLLYDIKADPDSPRFHPEMLKMLQVDPDHMPDIVKSTDQVGPLLEGPAAEMGVAPGIPVFSGGGDSALIGVGAGATAVGDTHLYVGTSGWASTVIEKPVVDVSAMIAGIVGAIPGRYNYFAELETAGKCLEWVRDHLALDEINIYLERTAVSEAPEDIRIELYDYLSQVIGETRPGAGGVLFTPWLHGNRCPFEDSNARGMFIGISLTTGKRDMLRAVIEGICYHLRWFVETQDKKVSTSSRIRFVGGGALSPVTSQILADVLQRPIDVVEHPQDVGAVGAALCAAAGLGAVNSTEEAASLVEVIASYEPNTELKELYDDMFTTFKSLHPANKKVFARLAHRP